MKNQKFACKKMTFSDYGPPRVSKKMEVVTCYEASNNDQLWLNAPPFYEFQGGP